MASLSPDEARSFVENLISSGKGDYGRLNHILTVLKEGRRLYDSDKKYLDAKLASEIGVPQKPLAEESIITKVQNLINSGNGDTGRLQFILDSLQQGKALYRSDQTYLESKLGASLNIHSLSLQPDVGNTIENLKSQVLLANQKIANLESVLTDKINHLADVKPNALPEKPRPMLGTMPKGWKPLTVQPNELEKVRNQIKVEQEKLDDEKTEADVLKIEQSKLMQIILNRKEFEKQVKIEHEKLEQQIELERQSVLAQAKIVEQIKTQESELAKAKKARDEIVLQLQQEQNRLYHDLQNQKDTLNDVKKEHQKISSELTKEEQQVAQEVVAERQRLAEQAKIAQRIQSEKELLESIRAESESMLRATKSQESELAAQIKKESAKIALQTKLLKNITNYEKYLASSKEKQSVLTNKIEEQKKKITKTASSLSQIKHETDLLDKIIQERKMLEQRITSADSELAQIRNEKLSLEKQLAEQKSSITSTKKLETQKIRQLKKRKKELEQGIKKESMHLKNITNRAGI